MQHSILVRDALLLQAALDRKRRKKKEVSLEIGDAVSMSIMNNLALPERLQWSDEYFVFRRMHIESMTIRDLKKACYQTWNKTGLKMKRGAYAPAPVKMKKMLEACKQMITTTLQNDGITEQQVYDIIAPLVQEIKDR